MASTNSAPVDRVDVTAANFELVAPLVESAIAAADFVAFDCEMTGLEPGVPGGEHSYLDDVHDRYEKVYESARQFVINQFGLSAFRLRGGRYVAETFNFALFPGGAALGRGEADKRFLCQASSLHYLAQHRFDFNKAIYDGVPFMSLETRDRLLKEIDRRQPQRAPVAPSTPEDGAFVAALLATVEAWRTDAAAPRTLSAAVNEGGWRRLLAYSALEQLPQVAGGGRGFYVETVGDGAERGLLLTRATLAEVAAREAELRQQRIDVVQKEARFSNLFTALARHKVPLVGHNAMYDLAYMLNQFVGDFPTYGEFRGAASRHLPGGVYDTKCIAARLAGRHPGLFTSTALEPLRLTLLRSGHAGDSEAARLLTAAAASSGTRLAIPEVEHAEGFDRYRDAAASAVGDSVAAGEPMGPSYAHEAGFDAFMTGACFSGLLPLAMASATVAGPFTPQTEPEADAAALEADSPVDGGPANLQQPCLQRMRPFKNCVHLMHTDLSHASMAGRIVAPRRPHVVVVVAAAESESAPAPAPPPFRGLRDALTRAGIGNVRPGMERLWTGSRHYSAVAVSLSPGNASLLPAVIRALESSDKCSGCSVMSYLDYHNWKHSGDGSVVQSGVSQSLKRHRLLDEEEAAEPAAAGNVLLERPPHVPCSVM